jgi:hypothetical protein
MRSLIICCLIFARPFLVFCQQPVMSRGTHSYYLKKSENQQLAAKILFVGGALSAGIGLGITINNLSGLFDPNSAPPKNEKLAEVLGYSGLGIMAISVPFFISSIKNKQKAKQIYF